MLDICLLGTGGMMPLPKRFLTSLMCRYNGSNILIDCGEATQIAIKEKGWTVKPIDVICFTHYHADHISGLPGLLLAMKNAEREEPITMIGPKGLERVVKSLCVIAPEIPFDINFIEIKEPEESFEINGYRINAFKLKHKVTCYGYSIEIDRAGKFDLDKAKELGLPVTSWGKLQSGEDVEFEGETYTPDMVMGPARRGLKVTYATDSRPCNSIAENAKDSDLFICEGMYGEPDMEEKAKEKTHMTFKEACEIGAKAQPKEMWLTHYSPSLIRPWDYVDNYKDIFDRVKAGKDGMSLELNFDEE